MNKKGILAVAFSLLALPALSAETISVYFGTYTWGNGPSKGIYRSELNL